MPNIEAALKKLQDEVFKRTSGAVCPGLETEQALLTELGNPHHDLLVIHVAGTNGKGSVCVILEALFQQIGLRTGFYSSPHLIHLNERFRIDGEPISDQTLYDLLKHVLAVDNERCKKSGDRPATFFELTTAMAFTCFKNSTVNIALIETGMGGLWDATNVVIPLLSVITNVDLDHTHFLGESLQEIATEKCGIIKKGRPVILGAFNPELLPLVQQTASKNGSRLIRSDQTLSITALPSPNIQKLHIESSNGTYGRVQLSLQGSYQQENCATAIAAFEEAADMLQLEYDEQTIKKGLANVTWHGRFEEIKNDPPVILDGAHNAAGIKSLVSGLKLMYAKRKIALVCGFLSDKDASSMIRILSGVSAACWCVAVANDRRMPPEQVAALYRQTGKTARTASLQQALSEAENWAKEHDGIVVVTGSLFLVGEVLERYDGIN